MTDRYDTMLRALADGSLAPKGFSHRDHVGVAVAALRAFPFFDALSVIANGLQAMAQRAGKPEKFHATITLASLCLIAARLEAAPVLDTDAFIDANPDLLDRQAFERLYPPDVLASETARRVGLLPGIA